MNLRINQIVMAVSLSALGLAACASPAAAPTPAPAATAAAPLNTAAPAPTTPPAAAPTTAPASTAPAAAPTLANTGAVTFKIVPEQSTASFTIDEVLNGNPKTVVGTTNQVAGALTLNLADLSQSQVGAIQVTASSLTTDSGFRNRAIRDFILNTGQYPTITFQPQTLTGLSGAGQPGQTFTFKITGDLTIRDITQPVTFDVTAQGGSATQLTGTATATIQRADFKLQIPSVPQVASVGEKVLLTLQFTAQAAN